MAEEQAETLEWIRAQVEDTRRHFEPGGALEHLRVRCLETERALTSYIGRQQVRDAYAHAELRAENDRLKKRNEQMVEAAKANDTDRDQLRHEIKSGMAERDRIREKLREAEHKIKEWYAPLKQERDEERERNIETLRNNERTLKVALAETQEEVEHLKSMLNEACAAAKCHLERWKESRRRESYYRAAVQARVCGSLATSMEFKERWSRNRDTLIVPDDWVAPEAEATPTPIPPSLQNSLREAQKKASADLDDAQEAMRKALNEFIGGGRQIQTIHLPPGGRIVAMILEGVGPQKPA